MIFFAKFDFGLRLCRGSGVFCDSWRRFLGFRSFPSRFSSFTFRRISSGSSYRFELGGFRLCFRSSFDFRFGHLERFGLLLLGIDANIFTWQFRGRYLGMLFNKIDQITNRFGKNGFAIAEFTLNGANE